MLPSEHKKRKNIFPEFMQNFKTDQKDTRFENCELCEVSAPGRAEK